MQVTWSLQLIWSYHLGAFVCLQFFCFLHFQKFTFLTRLLAFKICSELFCFFWSWRKEVCEIPLLHTALSTYIIYVYWTYPQLLLHKLDHLLQQERQKTACCIISVNHGVHLSAALEEIKQLIHIKIEINSTFWGFASKLWNKSFYRILLCCDTDLLNV